MRIPVFYSLILSTALLVSCKPEISGTKAGSSETKETEVLSDSIPDPFPTVVSFLNWYKSNYQTIQKFELVNWQTKNKAKPYSVNKEATEAYLDFFNRSGYVSQNYILNWRAYFMDRQLAFEKSPQTSGPPEGFEFDFVLFTQEIDWALESIDQVSPISIEKDARNATVNVDTGMRLKFSMRFSEGKWLIDNIENLGME